MPASSPPAYDGEADSDGTEHESDEEACMVEVLGMGDLGAGGVDDSFDEVPEDEQEEEDQGELARTTTLTAPGPREPHLTIASVTSDLQ